MSVFLSKSLRRLSKRYTHYLTQAFPQVHSEWIAEILLTLDGSKKITQKELCAQLEFDKSSIALMIKKLYQLQYVCIERNPEDKREHFVSLTEQGKDLIPYIKQAILKVNIELSQHLSQTQLIQFYSTIYQMEKNLSKQL